MESRGLLLEGQPLDPPSRAVTVRSRNGEEAVVDGPFTDAGERIVGFDIVECDTLEQAVDEARRHPMAPFGAIEVRAFAE